MTTKFFKRSILGSAIIAASVSLSGCFSGSDNDTNTEFSGATVSGVAAKGIVKNGVISVQELGAAKQTLRTFTSVDTDENGFYSVTIPGNYGGGPLQITLSLDEDSQMKCDAVEGCGDRPSGDGIEDNNGIIDFGEWFKPGAGAFLMTALLDKAQSNAHEIKVSITPFSHMAAEKAKAAANFDAAAILLANAEVSALLNLNILNVFPADITDANAVDDQAIVLAALSAALANLAKDNGTTLQEEMVKLISSYIDTGSLVGTDESDQAISLQDIIDQAKRTMEYAGINNANADEAFKDLQDDADNSGSGSVPNTPLDSATADAVGKAKALVADIRDYAQNTEATITDPNFGTSFTTEVDSAVTLLNNLETADNPVVSMVHVFNVLSSAIQSLKFDENGQLDENKTFTEDDDFEFDSGSVSISAANESETGDFSGTLTFTDADTGSQLVNLTLSFAGNYLDSDSRVNFELSTSAANGVIVTPSTVLELEDSALSLAINGASDSALTDGSLAVDFQSGVSLTVATSDSSDVVFGGTISSDFATYYSEQQTQNAGEYLVKAVALPKLFSFSGSVTAGEQATDLSFSASLPDIADFYDADNNRLIDETADTFMAFNASLVFALDLGELSDVTVSLESNRTALRAGETSLTLRQGERSLTLDTAVTLATTKADAMAIIYDIMIASINEDIVITDQNGTQLMVNDSYAAGEIAHIMVDGLTVGVIEETDSGLIKVSYKDGSFEFL
ncbi:exported hypothetical protein [uncultured Thiomicrorhabdus sp.]